MHLANEVPPQGSVSGNHLPDYALTADLLAERTLDGLLAEHPGELVRTGKLENDTRCESNFAVCFPRTLNAPIVIHTKASNLSFGNDNSFFTNVSQRNIFFLLILRI